MLVLIMVVSIDPTLSRTLRWVGLQSFVMVKNSARPSLGRKVCSYLTSKRLWSYKLLWSAPVNSVLKDNKN